LLWERVQSLLDYSFFTLNRTRSLRVAFVPNAVIFLIIAVPLVIFFVFRLFPQENSAGNERSDGPAATYWEFIRYMSQWYAARTICTLMLHSGTQWTLNASLTILSSYRNCSKPQILGHSAATDISAANRRHDEMLVHGPWFRIWQQFGACCRGEAEGPLRHSELRAAFQLWL
jgi:hypothetical protein